MEETNNAQQGMGFGITTETQSKNTTPFKVSTLHPFTKGFLASVIKEEVGKTEKYTVLTFIFKDAEGIRTYRHSEFAVNDTDPDKHKVKVNGLNVRIKHIYEAFTTFPITGIGVGASSWDDYFTKIALAFNTGNNGKPIYQRLVEEKTVNIGVWLKVIYDKKDNLGFPLSPMFIERITADNQAEPKTLSIDKRYDRLEQIGETKASTGMMGNVGGITAKDDFGF